MQKEASTAILKDRHSSESWNPVPRRFRMKIFYVYILCSRQNGTLYTGVTSNLIKRVYKHKNDLADGFTKKYEVHNLVWYEVHRTAESAIMREKQIKAWKRNWKLRIIEESNPAWNDLYESICK